MVGNHPHPPPPPRVLTPASHLRVTDLHQPGLQEWTPGDWKGELLVRSSGRRGLRGSTWWRARASSGCHLETRAGLRALFVCPPGNFPYCLSVFIH